MLKLLLMKKRKYPGDGRATLCERLLLSAGGILLVLFAATGSGYAQRTEANVEDRSTKGASMTSSYSGEMLRRLHPTNLLRALQIIDPSIYNGDTYETNGNDPNAVSSQIELQGRRAFAVNREMPSQSSLDIAPLVVVDGHYESMDRLHDMDIHRIESVTILKDASATAIYGVKAGNGAIVITTTIPADRELRLTYDFSGTFQKADMSSFDFMDATQKLDWEKSLGMYNGKESLYNERVQSVKENGSTDWVKMPLRTSFSHKHRIMVDGGGESMRYRAVVYAEPGNNGVMKGSNRDLYGTSIYVGYIGSKVEVTNELRVDIVDAAHSNYGTMSEWCNVNPYYAAFEDRGEPFDILGEGTFNQQGSPMYEASLKSYNEVYDTRINDNLNARWNFAEDFSLRGQFSLTKDINKQSRFVSPNSLIFKDYTIDEAEYIGQYSILRDKLTAFQEKLWVDYDYACGDNAVHALIGAEAYASTRLVDSYTGVGMSSNHMDYISFAQRYLPGARPQGGKYFERMLSGYALVQWAYADRLYIDLSGRLDKSSLLAPNKRTAGSYGINAAYNLKNTRWLEDSGVVGDLKVSVGYGNTAGHQFVYSQVNPIYGYYIDNSYLNGLGKYTNIDKNYAEGLVSLNRQNYFNPDLKWKSSKTIDAGVQAKISVIDLNVRYYNTLTGNLISMEQQGAYYGSTYKYANGGEVRNSGVEFSVGARVLQRKDGLNLNLFFNGVVNKNELVSSPDLNSSMFNQIALDSNSSMQMVQGNAVDGIYVFRSAGIDPQTGEESFMTKNGSPLTEVDYREMDYVGSATPKLRGSFGLNANYRNFDFGMVFDCSLGGKYYNLYEQSYIDKASAYGNVPVDAAQKWTPTNKNAKYQGINSDVALPSSRFVYTRNVFSLSSIHLGYSFNESVANKLYMKGLKLGLNCNDLFYSSSVDATRGLMYPYSRSFIVTLQAIF